MRATCLPGRWIVRENVAEEPPAGTRAVGRNAGDAPLSSPTGRAFLEPPVSVDSHNLTRRYEEI
jgi:hypothetical protein